MSSARIGCITLVYYSPTHLVGLLCNKGRGMILPGGKWEEGETFKETAIRELFEETNLQAIPDSVDYVFNGMSEEGYYTYAFTARCQPGAIEDVLGWKFGSGTVSLVTFGHLKSSRFKGYYEVLEQVMRSRQSALEALS